jgi:hypothetical protein
MDDGEALFNATWYGLVYGAAASWENEVEDARFKADYDWAFYRADGHNFNDEIDKLTQIHQTIRQGIDQDGEDAQTWLDPFSQRGHDFYVRLEPAAHQVRLLAEDVLTDLAVNRSLARRGADLLDYVDFAARRFDLLGQKAIYTRYISELYGQAEEAAASGETSEQRSVGGIMRRISGVNGLAEDLRDATSALRGRYRALWLGENRPYYLDNIAARYDAELARWNRVESRFADIRDEYRRTRRLPTLIEGTSTEAPTVQQPEVTPSAAHQPQTAPPAQSAAPNPVQPKPTQVTPGQPTAPTQPPPTKPPQ